MADEELKINDDVPEGQEQAHKQALDKARNLKMPGSGKGLPFVVQDANDEVGEEEDVPQGSTQSFISKQYQKLRKAKLDVLKEEQAKKKVQHKIKQYKRIKHIIRVIKLASMAGTSLGDVFFSLTVLFVTINGEWIYSKFNKKYPFDTIDKIMLAAGWAIILFAIGVLTLILIFLKYMYDYAKIF